MKNITLACVFFSITALCAAQPSSSIAKQVDSLNELAFRIKRSNINKALELLSSARNLALKNNYSKGLATSYLYEAGMYYQFGYAKRSLSLYSSALEISKRIKDSFNIARANQQIASAYKDNGKIKQAEALYFEALEQYKRLNKPEEVANVYNSIGLISIEEKDYSEAESVLAQALTISKSINYSYGEKKSLYNLGLLHKAEHLNREAIDYFTQALKIDEFTNDKYGVASAKLQLASVYNNTGERQKALLLSQEALEKAKEISAFQLIIETLNEIITAYHEEGNLTETVKWQQQLINTLNKQSEKEKEYAFGFLDAMREQDEREFNISKQALAVEQSAKAQKIFLIIAAFAFVVVSALAYLLYKNYNKSKAYAEEVKKQNVIIQKNSASLDQLNKAISKQNQKLEEENKMKDKLLSIISHDLRHPLVNTKSILELISLKLVTPKETEELFDQLESQYVKSIALLDNLLFWIKNQMQGKQMELMQLNIRHLISALIDEQRMPIHSKEINIQNNIAADVELPADREMLKIVFRNLISNAIKFTPSQGDIQLSSYLDDRFVYLIVKDSGIGMSKDTLQKVNSKQYYSSKGTSNERGSGFGLILCRDLINKHNGELMIESEPGRGSTFVVKLPCQVQPN